MPLTLDQLLKIDLEFPGISFGFESWALESYLAVLDEQIALAQAQYRLRVEHELVKAKENLDLDEYRAKLNEIEEIVDIQIPRFFRIGAVIPIWGMFESFLTDFALYVGRREEAGIEFRDVRANNFRNQIEKYFEGVLRIQLPWSNQERERLGQFQALRNFIAHRNGRLMDLPPDKEKKIRSLVAKISGVEIESCTVIVSSAYISEAAALVFSLVGRLSQQLSYKYDNDNRGGAMVIE